MTLPPYIRRGALSTGGQMGIAGGGQDAMVTEDFLHFQQIANI
jgi:hypothetical protein